MENQTNMEKLKNGTAIGYGIGAIGEGIGYNVFFSFFSFFLTTIAGIQPAIAGVISMVAVLWDAVTDPMIGLWSDRTKNPKGRRRPFIRTGSVLMCASVTLLFTNIEMSQTFKVIYFILMNAFYWVSLTSCVIPHISLGSELTEDFDERTKLRTYAASLMGVGTLIATSGTLVIVDFYTNLFGSTNAGWIGMGLTYGLLIILAYNTCCYVIKDREPANPNLSAETVQEKKGSGQLLREFWGNAKHAFQNRPLRQLLIITFAVNVVVTLGSGLLIYVFTYVYEYSDAKTSGIYFVQGILVILAVLVAGFVSQKTEKKTVMAGGIILYMLAYLVVMIFPISDVTMYVSILLYALGNSSYWTMIYAMSYDTAIIEQIKTGDKPDGLYTSLIGLFMKVGNSLGSLIVGVGLQIIGFSSEVTSQSASTIDSIRVLYGIAPSLVLLIGFFVAMRYPLTKKTYNKLVDLYHAKKDGGDYDEEILNKVM
ncbi:MAG: MFS transporter [Anaerovoracaceae bacterium]